MAYALVVWRRDGNDDEVEQALLGIPAVPFMRGLVLVKEDGPGWTAVRDRVRTIVEAHPGTEAVIIMPSKGSRVGGWVHDAPSHEQLEAARSIMNRGGSSAVPQFFATPPLDE